MPRPATAGYRLTDELVYSFRRVGRLTFADIEETQPARLCRSG